jgi:hypothetical protein
MTLKNRATFIWLTIAVGWIFDFLFWDKVAGVSFPIFVIVALSAGFFLARQQGLIPAKNTLWLLLPIAFFATMTVIRLEPLTRFLNVVATLIFMGLLAHSFLGGGWWLYTFKDYIASAFNLGVDALVRQVAIFNAQPKEEKSSEEKKGKTRQAFAILRGLLLALPIILILTALLAEADPIFEQNVDKFLKIFKIENLGEYIFRGIYILIFAYLLMGVLLHAFYKNHDEGIAAGEKPWISRFLGFIEAVIVLGSTNLLFLAFVVIQFQYFFGGRENITLEGYTYAEYARRGFGELVTVAIISLMLFLGLSSVTKREGERQGNIFSAFGIVLVALVNVILVSSFQRLHLYELAYGYTRLRIYTHVFIIWLGLLLAAVVVLELLKRQRHFAFSALMVAVGFIISLNILNVDAFIARQNANRVQAGEELDITYLASLSEDVVPALGKIYTGASGSGELLEEITGAIACHAAVNGDYDYGNHPYQNYTWQSFHLARYQAQKTWQVLQQLPNADDFSVFNKGENSWTQYDSYVMVNGEKIDCYSSYYGWD